MLKFFRKIRQNLLKENHFSKYLLYAIGEILLVVIGILIAVQINNWNEARKEKIMERQILEAILDNLVEDKENLNHSIQCFEEAQRRIERLIVPSQISKDSIAFYYFRAYRFEPYIPIRAAFDRTISSGTFDLIQDKKLTQKIQRLYSFELTISDFQLSTLKENHSEMRNLSKDYDVIELRDPGNSQSDTSFAMAFNPDLTLQLLEDDAMKKLSKTYYANAHMISNQYRHIQSKNKAVQKEIQTYLKNY